MYPIWQQVAACVLLMLALLVTYIFIPKILKNKK